MKLAEKIEECLKGENCVCSHKMNCYIILSPRIKSVLDILCIMLNSLLNRYITLEKKVETCCSRKGPIENGHYFAVAR